MRDAIQTSDARVFVKGYLDLLTAEEESALFRAWWDTNPQGFADLLDPEKEEVTRFVGGNDDLYLTRIVILYGPVIRRAMKELANYKAEEEELLAEGLIALAEAARRFAPQKFDGNRFAAYAKVCVKGMMQGYIMKNYFPVQFCTNHNKKRLFYSMRKRIAVELLAHGTFKMTPEVAEELATSHSLDVSDVLLMYDMFQKPSESLDQPVSGSFDDREMSLLGETMEDTEADVEDVVFRVNEVEFHRRLINDAMQVLTPRERIVFTNRVLTSEVRTLDDLGDEFDVSKERIRQINIEAVRKVDEEIRRLVDESEIATSDMFSD